MTRRCFVVGSPIAHSRSPVIHRLFAEQCGLALEYHKREVQPGTLASFVRECRESGVTGLNVTLPLKEEAVALAGEIHPRAKVAGAANTLWFDASGVIHADNTDGTGLLRDLACHGVSIRGRSVLLIGAGGAARGVLPALLAESPSQVSLMNRTQARAEQLAATHALPVLTMNAEVSAAFDVVINSTSVGVGVDSALTLSPSLIDSHSRCYDLVYAREMTPFQRWAQANGVQNPLDGLGMLVEQAAEAFQIWHGRTVDTGPVIAFLRHRA
jgi:shikimate dehydrogenase